MKNVVLILCGSFNPITTMHLNMFRVAKRYLESEHSVAHRVLAGIVSPVNDKYSVKKTLASSVHRIEMIRRALNVSPANSWIKVDDFESLQPHWTRTVLVLKHFENSVKHGSFLDGFSNIDRNDVNIKVLCGADLIETFMVPNLWLDSDIEEIVSKYGLVVIPREGSDPEFIVGHHILKSYQENVIVVKSWNGNEVSATRVREAIKNGESVEGLVEESVAEYIFEHKLY